MPVPTKKKSTYRPCAGVVLFNDEGKVWVGKRAGASGQHVWQFPQGGIDDNEPPYFAALRELYEETGTHITNVAPLGKVKEWLYYDFPEGHTECWSGQRQRWFAYRYKGEDKDFDLSLHSPVEFTEFKWIDLQTAAEIVVPFKRKVYEQIAREFAEFACPKN